MIHCLAMDPKSLRTLEFPAILEKLAAWTSFSASRELALGLIPVEDLENARRLQAETTQARALLKGHPDVSVGGARNVRDQVRAAGKGAVLEPEQLLDIQGTLISSRKLQRFFQENRDTYPLLRAYFDQTDYLPDLIKQIGKVIDERGEILDSASELLGKIRRDLRVAHDRLSGRLDKLLSDPKVVPLLQESIITQREGRYVIPIRAEFKSRIKAVVHDQSASGATLFVEPVAVVELNNRMRELELAERDEIRRVLAELSSRVGEHGEAIKANVDALAHFDLALAKGKYAGSISAIEPAIHEMTAKGGKGGRRFSLLQARHPLLDPEKVVPIDLILEEGISALVITGPNTGGKTVTLKTAGLLAIMAAAGLHLSVSEGSAVSLFNSVYADIGDEQSIEQSLSTFSAHISNLIRILDLADPGSLVLVDELGAGTDPQEGSALARSILEEFLSRGITILVATHFPELKFYAHGTPGVRNASVEFDLDSLRPTYRLSIGLPGRSNALAIAKRLGLDEFIIDRARQWVSPEDLKTDSLLDEIFQQRDQAQQSRQEMEQARERVEGQEAELNARLGAIEEERREILEEAREEARNELEVLRDEMKALRRQLARAGEPLSQLDSIERELDAVGKHLQEPVEIKKSVQSSERPFKEGDRVYLRSIQSEGLITDLGEAQAEIQVGRLRVRANLHELAHARDAGKWESGDPGAARTKPAAQPLRSVPPLELDLRGMTSDEALDLLERHLDSAYLAGMPYVRIIHGKGTGRLREAIREFLQSNVYVSSFEAGQRSEGGEGATVVRIDVG
jgi:DNA mismatch repair protein MutS2